VKASRIELLALERSRHTVRYAFGCTPDLEPLLWDNRVLELSCSEGVRGEPELLAAAFLFAFAPVGWMFGAEILSPIPVCGAALTTLKRVGLFVQRHYKWRRYDPFARTAVAADLHWPRHQRGLMFSGGVDSCAALVGMDGEGEAPVDWLIHLSNFENLDSRTTPRQRAMALAALQAIADRRGLGLMHLRTNLAEVFKHNRFDDRFPGDCSFWLGLQHVHHIATALAVVRPLLAGVSLAGGFSELLQRVGSCAASAAYVGKYAFPAPLRLLHERVRRQQKVERLIDQAPDLLRTLRVCYTSGNGTCADCRKCQATALMILAGGGRLTDASFPQPMASRLLAQVAAVRREPEARHRFFFQALAGRALGGTRDDRWDHLTALLQAAVKARPPHGGRTRRPA
jgi:hypothetical protein